MQDFVGFTLSSENNLKKFLHLLQPSENIPEIGEAFPCFRAFYSYKNKPEEGLIWDYSLEGGFGVCDENSAPGLFGNW